MKARQEINKVNFKRADKNRDGWLSEREKMRFTEHGVASEFGIGLAMTKMKAKLHEHNRILELKELGVGGRSSSGGDGGQRGLGGIAIATGVEVASTVTCPIAIPENTVLDE